LLDREMSFPSLPLFDVVIVLERLSREVKEELVRLRDEAVKCSAEAGGGVRPVDVFLSKVEEVLTTYELERVVVFKDIPATNEKELFDKMIVGFKTAPHTVLVFPKYPVEEEPIDLNEFLSVFPFLGNARRVYTIPYVAEGAEGLEGVGESGEETE